MEIMTAMLCSLAEGILICLLQGDIPQTPLKTTVLKKFIASCGACLAIGAYVLWLYGFGKTFAAVFLLTGYYLAITPDDIKEHLIADKTTLIFGVLFILFRLTEWSMTVLFDAALGLIAGLVVTGLPYLLHRASIGTGDIKAIAISGILLGPLSLLSLLARAFLLAMLYSVVQLIRKKITLKSELAFAPFLLIAVLI